MLCVQPWKERRLRLIASLRLDSSDEDFVGAPITTRVRSADFEVNLGGKPTRGFANTQNLAPRTQNPAVASSRTPVILN
jgi:hypothetical protein